MTPLGLVDLDDKWAETAIEWLRLGQSVNLRWSAPPAPGVRVRYRKILATAVIKSNVDAWVGILLGQLSARPLYAGEDAPRWMQNLSATLETEKAFPKAWGPRHRILVDLSVEAIDTLDERAGQLGLKRNEIIRRACYAFVGRDVVVEVRGKCSGCEFAGVLGAVHCGRPGQELSFGPDHEWNGSCAAGYERMLRRVCSCEVCASTVHVARHV